MKLKKFLDNNILYIIFSIIIGIFIIKYQHSPADDIKNKELVESLGVLKYIKSEYFNWSGRLSMTIIAALIHYNLFVWKLLNILVSFLFIKSFSLYYKSFVTNNEKIQIDKIIFICFFFIFPYTVTSSVVWMSGSYQYLWPVTAFTYAMFPFYKIVFISPKLYFSKINWILYYFSMFCAAYVEQEFLVIFVLSTISMFYLTRNKTIEKKEKKKIFYYYYFFLINLIVSRISPGLQNRISTEIKWYPNWENMPFIYRFSEVINLANKHLVWGSNILFLVFILLLTLLVYKKWKNNMKLLFLPLIYILLKIFPLDIFSKNIVLWYFNFENYFNTDKYSKQTLFLENIADKFLFDMTKIFDDIQIPKIDYISSIVTFTIIIFLSFILYNVFEDKKKAILCFLIYWAGFCSVYITVFMPAVYAIGSRLFFLMNSFFLFLISQLYLELKVKYNIDQKKYFKIAVLLLSIYSFLIILSYNNYLAQSLTA